MSILTAKIVKEVIPGRLGQEKKKENKDIWNKMTEKKKRKIVVKMEKEGEEKAIHQCLDRFLKSLLPSTPTYSMMPLLLPHASIEYFISLIMVLKALINYLFNHFLVLQ